MERPGARGTVRGTVLSPPPAFGLMSFARYPSRNPARLGFLLWLAACGCSSADRDGGGTCEPGTDFSKDLLHCGACESPCDAGEDCVGGTCACVAGLSPCPAGCENLDEDPRNCGACGTVCPEGQVCSHGACGATCATDRSLCAAVAACANFAASPTNCGTCGTICEVGQACSGGLCVCTQGRADCGAGCTDLATDPLNCGACGTVCAANSACSGGMCQGVVAGVGGSVGPSSGGAPAVGGSPSTGGLPASGGQESGGAPSGGGDVGSGGTGGSSGDCTATGFYVEAGLLYDANCNEFTMRGINYPYAWYATRDTEADLAAMAAAGANSVRIVMATGDRWDRTAGATVTSLINWAKAAQMIAVLEVHDVTGYAEQADSVPLSAAQSYWTAADITGALTGQEAFALINIANEPNGNDTSPDDWAPSHIAAVQAMRTAGLHHTLVVDAPNWGQDWENTMRDGGGASIWQADAEKNMIFSVHMYDVYGSANTVTSYFNSFLAGYEAPLIVGEFAADHGSSGDVDEATIMSFAEMLGIGYLGWSWSGNGDGLETLDMTTNFDASSLTTWGTTLTSGANGLLETSDVCSVFQ